MITSFPSPVLAVTVDAVKKLEGGDALTSLWTLFTKCKESLQDGRRLENISWRLWYREMASSHPYRPLTPESASSTLFDEKTDAPHNSTVNLINTALKQDHHESLLPVAFRSSTMPHALSPHDLTTITTSTDTTIPRPPRSSPVGSPQYGGGSSSLFVKPNLSCSVGKIICDIIPQHAVPLEKPHSSSSSSSSVLLLPSGSGSLKKARCPLPAPDASRLQTMNLNSSLPTPANELNSLIPSLNLPDPDPNSNYEAVPSPSTQTHIEGEPSTITTFPRVIVVNPTPNPTPHPTPPTTPTLPVSSSTSAVVGVVPVQLTLSPLVPTPRALPSKPIDTHTFTSNLSNAIPSNLTAPTNIKPSTSTSISSPSTLLPAPKMTSPPPPTGTLKTSEHLFFLKQSPDGDSSPERGGRRGSGSVEGSIDHAHGHGVPGSSTGSSQSHARTDTNTNTSMRSSVESTSKRSARGAVMPPTTGTTTTTTLSRKGKEPVRHHPHPHGPAHVKAVRPLTKVTSMGKIAGHPHPHGHPVRPALIQRKSTLTPAKERDRERGDKDRERSKDVSRERERTKTRPTFNIGSASSNGSGSKNSNSRDGHFPLAAPLSPPPAPPAPVLPPVLVAPPPPPAGPSRVPPAGPVVGGLSKMLKPQPLPQTQNMGMGLGMDMGMAPILPPSKGPTRRIVVSTSSEDDTYSDEDEDDDSWASESMESETQAQTQKDKSKKQTQKQKEKERESEEARKKREAEQQEQREKDMFAKVPKRSYSNLNRTKSGLLSQLLNPDPTIFPVNHPYRTTMSSQDMTRLPRASTMMNGVVGGHGHGHGYGQTSHGMGSWTPGAGLQTSKSAAALPVAAQVTVAQIHEPNHEPQTKVTGMTLVNGSAPGSVSGGVGGGGGYRPKGRPQNQEMEDDSDSEEENPEDSIQVSKSVAQQKLAALAGRRTSTDRGAPNANATGTGGPPPRTRPTLRSSTTSPPPQRHQNYNPNHNTSPTPTPTTTTTPIPLGHPYNLPPPAAPSTPRTTRRLMLQTEMSESLRRNLLWERQVSKINVGGTRRQHSSTALSNGLRPLTAVPSMVQLTAKTDHSHEGGGSGSGAANANANGAAANAKKPAVARNRSWADDYHYSGW